MNAPGGQFEAENEGYTLAALEWLQLQYRLRHAVASANCVALVSAEKDDVPQEDSSPTLAARFGGKGLTKVISDAEKLKRVRDRRERYLSGRSAETFVDFLLRLRTNELLFVHVRQVESKGLSYWYRRTEDDYRENWFLRNSTVRRYYEEVQEPVCPEPHTDKLGHRLITMTAPVDLTQRRRRLAD